MFLEREKDGAESHGGYPLLRDTKKMSQSVWKHPTRTIPVKSTDFGGSLPIFYLSTANLPIYHNLPISTDFFADLPNFNFF